MEKEKKEDNKENNSEKKESSDDKEELSEKDLEKINKQHVKQLRTILLMMLGVAIAGMLVFFLINSTTNFGYAGIKFQKGKLGEITFYEAEIPLINPSTKEVAMTYQIAFRTNPRKLSELIDIKNSLGTEEKSIDLLKYVILSFDTGLNNCENNVIGSANIARYLNYNQIIIKGATTNETYANDTGTIYATCQNKPTNISTYIVLYNEDSEHWNGRVYDKTTIINSEEYDNCYEIYVKNCESLEALERIMITHAANSLGREL